MTWVEIVLAAVAALGWWASYHFAREADRESTVCAIWRNRARTAESWLAKEHVGPTVAGPDADGMLWISGETEGVKGAVSVVADTICGRAFMGYVKEGK